MNKLFRMLQDSFGSAPNRNGFDLSRREIFSTKVGMKLPVFALETVPGDYHEIRPVDLIRTMPFNDANFVRMKQHLDFYWVPMSAFQTNFHEVVQQTEDPVNSLMVGDYVRTNLASFPLAHLVVYIAMAAYADQESFVFLPDFMLNVLGYGEETYPDYLPSIGGNGDKLQYLFFSGIRDITTIKPASDMFDYPVYQGAVRLLDMLGYGNYLPIIAGPYGVDEPEWVNMVKSFLQSIKNKHVNLFRFAAYQCIYQNFGLNTTYDKLDIYSFNFDDVINTLSWMTRYEAGAADDPCAKIRTIFTLRYSQWKKDIFTAAYPDSQFGGVSVVSVNHSLGRSLGSVNQSGTYGLRYRPSVDRLEGAQLASGSHVTSEVLSHFSILDLRRAEALQGWKEDMMRSGFRAKSRQRSQFGVSPSYDPHCMPYVLGSVSSDVRKDVVTGTAGEEFAQLAATGLSTMGNELIRFDGSGTKDYGIIMGVMSIVPEADYDSFGLDPHNTKLEPFDFYTPAFQNLGLQALPSSALSLFDLQEFTLLESKSVHGYVPRYSEYKQAVDKVHGEFCAYLKWDNAHTERVFYNGEFRHFVSTRLDMELYGLQLLSSLYVNPNIVDDVFKLDADGRQATDQFFVNLYCEVKSVRPMSILGLPRF